uniref:Cofilin n=1 Tax=Ogataea thermomethanolica (nom. inval.) TaxID=310468 RepID=A0A7R6UXJ7_9ASCO|nr:cofilin [Ogataea thermomethanolica (nom. inval.)]
MSNQSGINCSQELVQAFRDFVGASDRALLMAIENEQVIPKRTITGSNNLKQDFDLLARELADEAVYVVVRNDDIPGKFIFVSFVLDDAPVRSKMLYASTKNTVIRQLGVEFFHPVVFINDRSELSAEGYELLRGSEEKPLSSSEESLATVKRLELLSGGGIERRKQQLVSASSSGLQMDIDTALWSKIKGLGQGETVTIVIGAGEQFQMGPCAHVSGLSAVSASIPTESPTYTVANLDGYYFIYCCPSGSKVRDRMVYASSKQGLLNELKSGGIEFIKVVEVGDPDEIVADHEDQPAAKPASQTFNKPKGPRRR